jgi:excinuclease ABC subunit C
MIEINGGIKNGIAILKEKIANMPCCPGVYQMLDQNKKHLYIGKAKNLPKRVVNYTHIERLPNRLRRMVSQIHDIEIITTKTEAEALLLEASLIKSLKPVYNIDLRDDKSFPYIVIEKNHEYPRITKFRGKLAKNQEYYGPFASAGKVNETIVELQKMFLIRPCSDSFFASRERPCLQYQIKRCSAPCVEKISQPDYTHSLQMVRDFLSGKSSDIQKELTKLMEKYSSNFEYERAAEIRDRIKLLTQMQAKNIFHEHKIKDADIIASFKDSDKTCIQIFFIRGGKSFGNKAYFPANTSELDNTEIIENFIGQFYQKNPPPLNIIIEEELPNKQLIEEALTELYKTQVIIRIAKTKEQKDLIDFVLDNAKEALRNKEHEALKYKRLLNNIAKLFALKSTPRRIEVYDNSHIQGQNSIGAMVVFKSTGFDKNSYRKYKIKTTQIGDDYAMLREVLTRRLKKLEPDNYPDLLLIDGGKGQLSIARQVLEEFNLVDSIKIVAISKGPNRNAGREYFHTLNDEPFQLPRDDENLHFLQLLRNEVHRFAITSHRKAREKNVYKSQIDDLPGIGPKKKKAILNYFGSFDALKEARIEDIIKIDGISHKIAKKIYDYLHNTV